MASEPLRPIEELLDDDELTTGAIRQGIREELLSQARAGISVPESKDGKVVWLSPDQIFERLGYVPASQARAS